MDEDIVVKGEADQSDESHSSGEADLDNETIQEGVSASDLPDKGEAVAASTRCLVSEMAIPTSANVSTRRQTAALPTFRGLSRTPEQLQAKQRRHSSAGPSTSLRGLRKNCQARSFSGTTLLRGLRKNTRGVENEFGHSRRLGDSDTARGLRRKSWTGPELSSSTSTNLHTERSSGPSFRGLRRKSRMDSRGSISTQTLAAGVWEVVGANPMDQEEEEYEISPRDLESQSVDEPSIAVPGEFDEPLNESNINSPSFNSTDLVEATPVTDVIKTRVTMVSPEELERVAIKKQKETECRRIGAALILASILVITLSAVFAPGRDAAEKGMPTAAPPSWIPSSSPSMAPTSVLNAFINDHLPIYSQQALNIPSSPQFMAYTWLLGHPEFMIYPVWRQKQLFALATFFYSFAGPNWPEQIKNDWMDYKRGECQWFSSHFGYFEDDGSFQPFGQWADLANCDEEGRYQALGVTGLKVGKHQPSLPREIELLTSLEAIMLSYNEIEARLEEFLIPEVYQLPDLWLLVTDYNMFTGPIPTEMGMLSNLEHLSLYWNAMTGPIPTEFGQLEKATDLICAYNSLSGPIPSEIALLTTLQKFDMRVNRLSGAVSPAFGLPPNLTSLYLGQNRMTGTIPSSLGILTQMTSLDLNSNAISGSIPTELSSLSSLKHLSLFRNFLTGPLSAGIGSLTNLEIVYLGFNSLTGEILKDVGAMARLQRLLVNTNSFTGDIPTSIGLLSDMEYLGLGENALTGRMPSQLGLLKNLTYLDLADLDANGFRGTLPSEIGSLVRLQRYLMSNAGVTGRVPSEVGTLTNLHHMTLANNLLEGSIPSQFGLLADLGFLNISGNDLHGMLPNELCSLQDPSCFYTNLRRENRSCELIFDCTFSFCGCDCGCEQASNATNETQNTTARTVEG